MHSVAVCELLLVLFVHHLGASTRFPFMTERVSVITRQSHFCECILVKVFFFFVKQSSCVSAQPSTKRSRLFPCQDFTPRSPSATCQSQTDHQYCRFHTSDRKVYFLLRLACRITKLYTINFLTLRHNRVSICFCFVLN